MRWKKRSYLYGAAAEAMRRILIKRARRRKATRRGGDFQRAELVDVEIASPESDEELLQLNEALQRLQEIDAQRADIVRLRFFAGFPVAEAATMPGMSKIKAKRSWGFIRVWLQKEMTAD